MVPSMAISSASSVKTSTMKGCVQSEIQTKFEMLDYDLATFWTYRKLWHLLGASLWH